MQFDDLDKKMRFYEQSLDQYILPELYLAARLDGRNFTKVTKKICQFEAPFDLKFRDAMIETVKHLMDCGFRFVYGFTESDEISLLFHPEDYTFSRKSRKLNSILAGEASAAMSIQLNFPVCFDCRMVPLPTLELVKDYFSWRQEDAHRNALNAHCYWILRKENISAHEATAMLEGKSVSDKNELLFSKGINFNTLPNWQKRGSGVYYTTYEKEGFDPVLKEKTITTRKKLIVDYELPIKEEYANWVAAFIS